MPPSAQSSYSYFITSYQFMATPSVRTVEAVKPHYIKALDICDRHCSLILFHTQQPHTIQHVNEILREHDAAVFYYIELAFNSIEAIAQPSETIANIIGAYTWMWSEDDDELLFDRESLSSRSSWSDELPLNDKPRRELTDMYVETIFP